MTSVLLSATDQLHTLDDFINDPRGSVPTGFGQMDSLLRKGGLAPGELALLVGKSTTRKTTLTSNVIVSMLKNGVRVGLVGLDGNLSTNYISRILSVVIGEPSEVIEATWNERKDEFYPIWESVAGGLSLYNGPFRPAPNKDLRDWLIECEATGSRPEVIFVDYISLLYRTKYDGKEQQRIFRLIEELQVFAHDESIAVVGLHQVSRTSEGVAVRYHGDTPLTLESMKWGGEEVPDIVWCTYRPALDPISHMTYDMARRMKGDKFTYEEYLGHKELSKKYEPYTFWQLVKNRNGTRLNEVGLPLRSEGETMRMVVDESVLTNDDDESEQMKAFGNE